MKEGCQESDGGGLVFYLRSGSELEGKVGEVCHLGWAGVGVEEVKEVSVIRWEAVAKVDRFHGGEEGVRGVVIVEVAWTS